MWWRKQLCQLTPFKLSLNVTGVSTLSNFLHKSILDSNFQSHDCKDLLYRPFQQPVEFLFMAAIVLMSPSSSHPSTLGRLFFEWQEQLCCGRWVTALLPLPLLGCVFYTHQAHFTIAVGATLKQYHIACIQCQGNGMIQRLWYQAKKPRRFKTLGHNGPWESNWHASYMASTREEGTHSSPGVTYVRSLHDNTPQNFNYTHVWLIPSDRYKGSKLFLLCRGIENPPNGLESSCSINRSLGMLSKQPGVTPLPSPICFFRSIREATWPVVAGAQPVITLTVTSVSWLVMAAYSFQKCCVLTHSYLHTRAD